MEYNKLPLSVLEQYLGSPERNRNNEIEWQCPICAEEGNDNSRDNLKYNTQKGVLYCFANPQHSKEILKRIYKDIGANRKNKEEFIDPQLGCLLLELFNKYRTNLLKLDKFKKEEFSNMLYEKRGITFDTAEDVGLGFCFGTWNWAIPSFKYSSSDDLPVVTGFEFRPFDFSKDVTKSSEFKSCLSMINAYGRETEILVIVEGYLDGYSLFQYLRECNQEQFYHIVTPSNGAQSLLKQISVINFDKYKKWYLFLDNDDVGNDVAAQVLDKYPFFEQMKLNCGCKDFNEHYLKCILNV